MADKLGAILECAASSASDCVWYDAEPMTTVFLLVCSNLFMTVAWYGHLKYRQAPLILGILARWSIAFFEYCFQVPANRIGYGEFTAFQLKVIQEVITLGVFVVFAWWYLGERTRWNHGVSFLFSHRRGDFCVLGQAVTFDRGCIGDEEVSDG